MPWFRKGFVFMWLTGNMKSRYVLMSDIKLALKVFVM